MAKISAFRARLEECAADPRATVIALHCSGAGGAMWQPLRNALGSDVRLLSPDLYGAADGPDWPGDSAFSLDAEAAPIIGMIDNSPQPVHLVGHSYGGAVALYAALKRPSRIASLALYEPANFHLLKSADGIEYGEILWLARDVDALLLRGDHRGAMKRFVNYWNGAGAWDLMSPDAQRALMQWAPKAALDFRALLEGPGASSRFDWLDVPCHIVSGERSPDPVREIARIVCDQMPNSTMSVLPGAGHMGPITHGAEVAARMAGHIRRHQPVDPMSTIQEENSSPRFLEASIAK
ncbi:alpha/beta fold hydrolase [Dongia sp.]|uniref:alpha/beta fold hydrolase n=1 Tax=Dongia sp. TaxID=1977262 RepID=UPI0035AE72A1